MLINTFRAFAAEKGACRIELKTVSGNQCAIDLYRKLSFTETKKYMKMEL
jgi:ribosomal protein S18 acetylase RimI-like enzyme